MRKTTSRMVVAVAAIGLLGACGGGTDSDLGADGNCDDSDTFKVGSILPITGVTADTGLTITEGAKIAQKKINADGGINGRCVEILSKDEGNDPTKAAQAASELIDRDGVEAILGPSGSGAAGAVAPIAAEAGIPFFHATTLKLDRDTAPLGFGVQITSDLIGPSLVDYAESQGWSTMAVLAVNNTFGTNLLDTTVSAAEDSGIEIIATEVHESGSVDLSPQLRTLRTQEPDVLVVASFGADAVAALKARLALGWDVPVVGPSGLSYDEVVAGAGPEGIAGVFSSMYPKQLAADPATGGVSEVGEELRTALKEATGEDPLKINVDNAALGHDAMMAIAEAFNGAGEDDPQKAADYLIENGYDGVRANYRWTQDDTAGFPLEANSIVIASSLADGVLTIAE